MSTDNFPVLFFNLLLFTFCMQFLLHNLCNVNCQVGKLVFTSGPNCSGFVFQTFYSKDYSACTSPTPSTCNSFVSPITNATFYTYHSECAPEGFPSTMYGFLTIYTFESTASCTGPIAYVSLIPLDICMQEHSPPYFVIYDSFGNRNLYIDNQCTNKLVTISLALGQCIPGVLNKKQLATTLGSIPAPQPQTYLRTGFYNSSLSGGASCSSSSVQSHVYSPVSNCQNQACKQVAGGDAFQNSDCVTVLPTSAAYSSVNIYRYLDQSTCQTQTGVMQLDVISINSCSPYSVTSNNVTETVYIKSDDCKFIRKYTDSSCLNEISQIDLSTRNGICDSTGVKYLCNANSGGNGGGTTPGNSTRTINSSETLHFQLSFMLSIISLIALFTF